MADTCANPLLLSFLKEWLDQARERNSKGTTVYKKAYESMKACPLTFSHPKEAQQLHGLGPKLCDRLTEKLKAHCQANGLPMPKRAEAGSKRLSVDNDDAVERPVKKARKTKAYVPVLRSGAYAIILALATLDEDASQGIPKPEVIELAQPHSDSSFVAPSDPTKFYTAWNSMKTLVGKDLVYEHGRPLRRYMLTEEGWEVAKRIKGVEEGSIQDLVTNDATKSSSPRPNTSTRVAEKLPRSIVRDDSELYISGISSSPERPRWKDAFQPRPKASTSMAAKLPKSVARANPDFYIPGLDSSPEPPRRTEAARARPRTPDGELTIDRDVVEPAAAPPMFDPIILPPGSFDVKLVLDSREVRTKSDRDYISSELQKRGLTCLTRALPLGDALWIAQVKAPHYQRLVAANGGDEGEGCMEIMLDHIVERKRLDDLIGSIKDGRFHEQKFRLRKSGVQSVTYIIEDFAISAGNGEKYGEAVESAISSMQVVNEYFVKQTSKLDDTIRYLERMTRSLEARYVKSGLKVIPLSALDSRTYLPLLAHLRDKSDDGHYITCSAFSSMCSKSETLTLRDVFLKMLMCTRGVTGERAIEIQKKWPTPRMFVEAYEALENSKAKETMLSDSLGNLIPRKKVAKGLSTKIAEVWA